MGMIKTTGYATMLSILMFYMHFRACMVRLSGELTIIPQWSELACFGAAGSVAVQALLVLLMLLDPYISNLGALVLLMKTLAIFVMYVSFGVVLYSCMVI